MDPEQRLAVIQRGVVREMARYGQEFTVDGALVHGPGSTAVALREHPGPDGGHVDLGFVLRLGSAEAPVLWDCTAGLGTTEEEKLDSAVRMWASTTAAAVVEYLEGQGRYGDHLRLLKHCRAGRRCRAYHRLRLPERAAVRLAGRA